MPEGARLRRLAPWLIGLALLAVLPPIAWGLTAYTASDAEVHPRRLIVEGTPEGPIGDLPPGPQQREPLYNLTVDRVVQQAPDGARVQAGETIEIMVPAYREEAQEFADQDETLAVALRSAQKHHPENGTVYWSGWELEDSREGALWTPQQGQVTAAAGTLGLSLGAGLLAGVGLLAHGRAPVRGWRELAGPLAALVLGLLLAGMAANTAGEMNVLFDWHFDGPPAPGPLGLALMPLLPILGAWGARSSPPGARTALVAGLGVLIGLALTITWLWLPGPGSVLDEFAAWALPALPLAVAGAAAARWLPGRRVRRGLSIVLGLGLVVAVAWGWPLTISFSLPLVGVLAPAVAELWGPSVLETSDPSSGPGA